MMAGKRNDSNKDDIAETEAYFEGLDKSLCKKRIEMLEERWNECTTRWWIKKFSHVSVGTYRSNHLLFDWRRLTSDETVHNPFGFTEQHTFDMIFSSVL